MPWVVVATQHELYFMWLCREPVIESLYRTCTDGGATIWSKVSAVHQAVTRWQRWELVLKAMCVRYAHNADITIRQARIWRAAMLRRVTVEQKGGCSSRR